MSRHRISRFFHESETQEWHQAVDWHELIVVRNALYTVSSPKTSDFVNVHIFAKY